MVFDEKTAEEIKEQLVIEVDKLPNENKEEIKEYIKGLDNEGLEEFLKKNNISYSKKGLNQESEENSIPNNKESKCIFCEIISGQIPSYKLIENKKALGILEINPLSKGHSIILPKEHITIEKMPKLVLSLAQKIAKRIKQKLKPEDIKIESSSFMNHPMINVIPIYKDIPLKKSKGIEEDLKKLKNKLENKVRKKRTKEKLVKEETNEKKVDDLSKLPKISFRIP